MSTETSVTDVLRNFSDYINRVVYRGEHFTLIRGGKPVAELTPIPATGGRRLADLPGLLESLPRLSADEADALARDMASGRGTLTAPPGDPWAS